MSIYGKVSAIVLLLSVSSICYSLIKLSEDERHCGVITKIMPETVNASGSGRRSRMYTERYVLVRFDNRITKAINLDPGSYYTASVNQKVCLNLGKSTFIQGYDTPYILMLLASFIIGFISMAILLDQTLFKM